MNYPEAIEFLYQLQKFGTRLGLENAFRLAEIFGHPQAGLRFIHVAGTNGKGSTCAMLESAYRRSGLKVGLFTSPHLVSFTERIQVNRQPISESDLAQLVQRMRAAIAAANENRPHEKWDFTPTLFEVVTVLGLLYFAEQKCDLVIWETGLGGRLDATNIVTPLASVITNIQFDHQQWLGDTLPKIAREKAGIIKPGIPVITGAMSNEALAVIQEVADLHGSAHHHAADPYRESPLSLAGEHQRHNAAVAVRTIKVLNSLFPIHKEGLRAALAQTWWPGRLQQHTTPSGQNLLLDGAHNLDGVRALATELRQRGSTFALITGLLSDKDWQPMLELILPFAHKLVATQVTSPRAVSAETLAAAVRALAPHLPVESAVNIREALHSVREENRVVITGSLHFIGESLEALGLSATPPVPERALNEWGVTPPNASKSPIRALTKADYQEWKRMRVALWPDCSEEMHTLEMIEQSASQQAAVLVYARPHGGLGGFVELSIRDRVDGSLSERCGYLEGWYVDEDLRGTGVGRALVEAAEEWTVAQGLSELASDAEIGNSGSIAAHAALGFNETFRLVHFLKPLKGGQK